MNCKRDCLARHDADMRRFLLIFFGWSSMVASGGTIEDTIPDSRYLAYGATFGAYTCRVTGVEVSGTPILASCVLVAPHWALTAAHVVKDLTTCEIIAADGRHRVDAIYVHRDWAQEYGWHDIALVHVASPFALTKYPPLTDGTEQIGDVCTAAGYGITGTLSGGITIPSTSDLRAGTQRLLARERGVYICRIERSGSPLPLCIAPGDSGGGLWGRSADGRTVLIGINSLVSRYGGGRPRHAAGEESCHTRIDLYREWIVSIAGQLDGECSLVACRKPH